MPDEKRMLSEAHKGLVRVWDLLAAKLPGYLSYEYVETINDTHMFRHAGDHLKSAQCTVRDGDFDLLPGVMDPLPETPTPKMVKCIDADASWGSLVHGQIYEVEREVPFGGETAYYLKGLTSDQHPLASGWDHSRFEVVEPTTAVTEETPAPSPTPKPPPFDFAEYYGTK